MRLFLSILFGAALVGAVMAQVPTQADHQQFARAAMEFLNRTSLNGSEAETMARVRAWLSAIASGQLTVDVPRQQPKSEPKKK